MLYLYILDREYKNVKLDMPSFGGSLELVFHRNLVPSLLRRLLII